MNARTTAPREDVSEGDPPERDEPILRLKGVRKSFGDVEAVRGVDLDLYAGEILTLLGPSGCGKTTTLRMVIGLERATGGQVVHHDRVLDDGAGSVVPIHRRNMGMVFQSYAIWPHMTVAENVGYPLRVRRMKRPVVKETVEKVLDLVSMSTMSDRPATQLSGGQQQRVALARALVFEPDLLLLDEPFSNLDARLRDEMRAEVKLMQRRLGITILFVTHDQYEAMSLSDRIAVMSEGRIENLATPEKLYERPRTRMVRDFLGDSVTLRGTVAGETDDAVRVRLDEGPGADTQVLAQRRKSQPLIEGRPCEVSIRPEDVGIDQPEGSEIPDNVISAEVQALLFLGDRYQARVVLGSGRSLFVYVAPGEAKRWSEGDTAWLRLPQEGLLVWADDEEHRTDRATDDHGGTDPRSGQTPMPSSEGG